MFGNIDVVVKFVFEGYDRGVNWVLFYFIMFLIVLVGDDCFIKLWCMSEIKVWEVDICCGYFQNVSGCLFYFYQDFIFLVGEDKMICVWDLNKCMVVYMFKRENDRFWVIVVYFEINFFVVGYDNGVMVFKLECERFVLVVY